MWIVVRTGLDKYTHCIHDDPNLLQRELVSLSRGINQECRSKKSYGSCKVDGTAHSHLCVWHGIYVTCKVDGTAHYEEDYAKQRIYVMCGVWHGTYGNPP